MLQIPEESGQGPSIISHSTAAGTPADDNSAAVIDRICAGR